MTRLPKTLYSLLDHLPWVFIVFLEVRTIFIAAVMVHAHAESTVGHPPCVLWCAVGVLRGGRADPLNMPPS